MVSAYHRYASVCQCLSQGFAVGNGLYDDVQVEIKALTEEQAQTIRDIVYGATTEASYDSQLLNIITEEAAYYFGGEKSSSEVAGIIQSRAQLYIDENR